MGFSDSVLLSWLVGAGLTVVFIVGYTGLSAVLSQLGPGNGIVLAFAAPFVGVLFMVVSLAVALSVVGIDFAVPIALVTSVLAGFTGLVSMSVFDELPDGLGWVAVVVMAVVIGFETVVVMLVVDGIAALVGHALS